MSVPVDLSELTGRIGELGPVAYLVTVGASGSPHVVSVLADVDGGELVTGAGRTTLANVAAHPEVTLLWPAPPGSGYALLVDGTARAVAEEAPAVAGLRITPTGAVLHRTPLGDAAQPSCITLLEKGPLDKAPHFTNVDPARCQSGMTDS